MELLTGAVKVRMDRMRSSYRVNSVFCESVESHANRVKM